MTSITMLDRIGRRRIARTGTLFMAATLLAGCGSDLLGSPEEVPLEGERISVLAQDQMFNTDPEAASILVALPAPVANADWPQAGGNADHAMHHLALAAAPTTAWRSSVGVGGNAYQPLVSEPVAAAGRIFALDSTSTLTALDLESGDQLWRRNLTPEDEDVLFGGGIVTDGARVFATTNYGYVYAVDAASGEILWATRIDAPIRAAPGLAADRLIVVTLDNRAIAMSLDTGEVLWTHSGPVATAGLLGAAAPAIAEGLAVVAYSSGEIFALDVANGQALWSDAISRDMLRASPASVSGITGRIVIDRGMVLVGGNDAFTAAIDLATGERVWERALPSATGPWAAGDFIYLITVDQKLICMTRSGGAVKWFLELPRFTNPEERSGPIDWAGPALAGDRLLLLSTEGDLMTVSPYTGEMLGSNPIGAGSRVPPIVVAGGLYLLLGDATLVALR